MKGRQVREGERERRREREKLVEIQARARDTLGPSAQSFLRSRYKHEQVDIVSRVMIFNNIFCPET